MLHYLHLPVDHPISIPAGMTGFKCLVLLERETHAPYRDELSNVIVRAGCLWAMTWGANCETWHDAIDRAFMSYRDADQCPDDEFVLTTWHRDEDLQEVMFFAKHSAVHPTGQIDDLLVLDFTRQDRGPAIRNLFQKS